MKKTYGFRNYYILLSLLLFLSLIISARVGAVSISYADMFSYMKNWLTNAAGTTSPSIDESLFLQIRLPRVILCALTGAALSVSGTLMQALFRNPIVEPGLVGTSSGSAFGAAIVFVLGKDLAGTWFNVLGPFILPFFAFAGGFIATLIVYRLSNIFGKTNVNTMLLAGIAINAVANSGTGFLSYIAKDPQARSITFWNLGTLSGADWHSVVYVSISTISGIILSMRFSKSLNALALGEREAEYLGVETEKLKMKILLLNTFIVAIATSFVGVISFVGLVVPHVLRLIKSSDNRFLIIASALLGGILLNLADMISRVIVAPSEFPIGIITALVGAPVFIYLLIRNTKKNQEGGFYA